MFDEMEQGRDGRGKNQKRRMGKVLENTQRDSWIGQKRLRERYLEILREAKSLLEAKETIIILC